ncbi:hypothetical protein VL04_02870 [Chromobacterium violaceum]|nr:hypothetical protein VK93_06130 [Chromobacterium violaceum]KMN84480.1 hypothetical protein VL02_19505 [Chromobacterium violaceum]KMN91794.1 hypothetical protein VL04_02870 [Chromobacterium violaceum]KMO03489.1 hypothetical protein VL16_13320 [Chromobacterium violaceum]
MLMTPLVMYISSFLLGSASPTRLFPLLLIHNSELDLDRHVRITVIVSPVRIDVFRLFLHLHSYIIYKLHQRMLLLRFSLQCYFFITLHLL